MNVYQTRDFLELVNGNPYMGRGIIAGESESGKAVSAYFIMGRSANSRNRVFAVKNGEVFTRPFDPSKVEDPSLIIYAALRSFENHLVFTNGDQTDTIVDGLKEGRSFFASLETRDFEPDAPNFTPRISARIKFEKAMFTYDLSILKSVDEKGSATARYGFSYPAVPGLGHFIHTYVGDGNPLPSFQGEPKRVKIPRSIDEFTDGIWNALNRDNRISLYVRFTDPKTRLYEERLINQNQ